MSEIITYRLPEHAYKLLEPIVLSRRNLGAAQKLFPGESEGLEKNVRGFLKKINTRYLSELTLVRISCFLSNFVSRMPKSDMATARSMFGHSGYQGRTQHHYTCRASLDLKTLYQNATLAIQDNGAAPQLIQRDFQADDHQTQSDEYLGSCLRPTDDSIKNLTTQIKQDLVIQKELLKTNWCMETAAEHHNLFTVYSALVTLFGTAFRAITDPSLPEAHIDRDMSFALLNDKGMNDNYNTRKIYLAPIVLKQITHYQRHISKLYDLSAGSHTEFIPWYRTHKSTGKVSSLFLFEAGSYKMTPLGPSTLMDFLSTKYNWHLPANSGRHVVRSLLLERNCPPGIIDAFLGHVTRGTEPWSVQSGLSPTYFREELAKHLIPILFEMGWTDISGLGGPAHE
jgi:hypothetical protein